MSHKILLATLLLALGLNAADIEVKDAYVRAVPPNLPNSASFMKISNTSNQDLELISAKSDIATAVELHEHVKKGEMMKMQQVQSIKIPANSTVELKPGGLHVMFLGLNKKLKDGEIAGDVELVFSNNEVVKLKDLPIKTVMMGMMHNNKGMKH